MKWNLPSLQDQQYQIAQKVILTNSLPTLQDLHRVAGTDISCGKWSPLGYAAVVVFAYPQLEILEISDTVQPLDFPYIPGYLGFREWPLVRSCLEKLTLFPEVLICDGQGIAHPRRAGLASHIGVESGLITVGCAKSRLVGEYVDPGPKKGEVSDLSMNGERIGVVLRTKDRVKPLFISPGHQINFDQSVQLILSLCRNYRLPEPIRAAHRWVNKLRVQAASAIIESKL